MPSPGLLEAVRRLPNQVRDVAVAAADTEGLPDRRGIRMVVIFGVGAGRVAGDVIEALSEFHASVPVISAGALTQSWIDDSTLAIVLSPWGEEAGTVPALEDALAAGARVVAVTSGGELGKVCAQRGVPVVPVDPQAGPAVGLGVLIVPVLVLLERLGVATGVNRVISNVAAQFQDRHRSLDNEADAIERLAEVLRGRIAIVTGAGAVGKHAARRWVMELDRVGNTPAVRRSLPRNPSDVSTSLRLAAESRNGVVVIVLRHDFEPQGLDGGVSLLDDSFDEVHTFSANGNDPLSQMLDLLLLAAAVGSRLARSSAG